MYHTFQKQSQSDLNNELTKNVNISKLLFKSALEDAYKTFTQRKNLFAIIHQTTIDEFKKDENIPLDQLKHKIMEQFHLKDLDLDIYLINKEYVITDATFKKDIGLDFKNLTDAKMYLDKASQDEEIHIADNVSIDYMDSTIKVYSCASIHHDKFLEMAFIDPFIYNKLRQSIENISKSTNNTISLFRIIKTSSGEEYYEDIFSHETIRNKKEWINSLKKFPLHNPTNDAIINANRKNEIIRKDGNAREDLVTFYIPMLSSENNNSLDYNHFVMKLDIDTSKNAAQWRKNKNVFVVLSFALFILMLVLYYFIKYYFYIPITDITQCFENEVKIDDLDLLMKKDEFGTLIHKYNTLYTNLQNQIENNQQLLEENKQFIADMVHQIRTPLTVIMTNSSLIEMKSDLKVSSYITQINSAINMLSNSYEDLSYIISNDTIEYKPIKIDLSYFLKERIHFFEVIAQANDKTIHTNIANDVWITMNDTELERLIDNNLSNAIKHSRDKSIIEIVLEKNHSEILLKFISEGKHISDVFMIFDRNYTETHSAKRSLGLGLNMVKTICKKNNIKYNVQSEKGINTFTYIF